MYNFVKIKAVTKSLLRKSLGDRNYEKIIQLVRQIRSVNKNIFRKTSHLKFQIKGRILKRPVRILLSRYGGLGDILLTTPAIRALKKMFPRAFVVFDTSQTGKELLEGNPDIDQITINSAYCIRSSFDWYWHLTYEYFPELHIIEGYLKLIGLDISISNNEKKPIIVLSESDKKFAKELIESCGISNNELVMGLQVQAGRENRRWPLGSFLEVVDYVSNKYHAKIIEFGTKAQPYLGKGINLVGKCGIKESAAVLSKCTFLLCNDSFFLHAAGALNVPVVAIFGPSSPDKRLPFNDISRAVWSEEGCRGCIYTKSSPQLAGTDCVRSFIECMHAIKPEKVIEAIEKLISNHR